MAGLYFLAKPSKTGLSQQLLTERYIMTQKQVDIEDLQEIYPKWYPEHTAIYDIKKTYLDNLENGPFFEAEIPKREMAPKNEWLDFLGVPVASPLGIPAGPLLCSKGIKFASDMGFDLLTYKTIRSRSHPAHPLPNMVYVDPQLTGKQIKLPPYHLADLTVTNSFGNPSMSPEYLMEDIAKANDAIHPGQALIVSIYGTTHDDFVQTALFAKEAGAKIIEANFSCPNVNPVEGLLYKNAETMQRVGKQIADAIAPIPLIIKVGLFDDKEQMKLSFVAAAKAGIRSICGLNTISMKISPPLDENRKVAGVCGGGIRNAALRFIADAHEIITAEKFDLTLIGVGGIMLPQHVDRFLRQGAEFAMTATGMMWDPYLAMRYHHIKEGSND